MAIYHDIWQLYDIITYDNLPEHIAEMESHCYTKLVYKQFQHLNISLPASSCYAAQIIVQPLKHIV